jgi:PBP1b-binding outer membrane lipoprotein LpoB
MKKTSFVIAILASALLAGACSKKKDPAAPMSGDSMGSNTGSAMGSGDAMGTGSGMTPGAGSGSGAM